jgi:hypothetical protein
MKRCRFSFVGQARFSSSPSSSVKPTYWFAVEFKRVAGQSIAKKSADFTY